MNPLENRHSTDRGEPADPLDRLLESARTRIEPSAGFESAFWRKVIARQRQPWPSRLLRRLGETLLAPPVERAAGLMLIAFLVGNLGGLAFGSRAQRPPGSISQVVSAFHGTESALPHSLAASYLAAINTETSG